MWIAIQQEYRFSGVRGEVMINTDYIYRIEQRDGGGLYEIVAAYFAPDKVQRTERIYFNTDKDVRDEVYSRLMKQIESAASLIHIQHDIVDNLPT